ncbi:MAG: hypothetical protein IKA75_02790 [Bacteroidaceae bacterium]|nr:hypothetical protein [Bacteroidaceae bacterium]
MSISLYYSKENDYLYTAPFISNDALFTSHEEKGFHYDKPKFIGAELNFGINIQTNLGYGNASYLRAMLLYNDRHLVSCYNWCDSINCALSHFEVEPNPQNWGSLFTRIKSAYKDRDSWNYNCIIEIIEELKNKLLHPDKIYVRNHCWSTKLLLWSGNTAILHLTKKVNELILEIESLKIGEHKHIKEGTNSICREAIPIIELAYRNLTQEREQMETLQSTSTLQKLKRLETYYDTIYNYLKRTDQIKLLFEKKEKTI